MNKNFEIKKRLKIILPEDWSNNDKGRFWEDIVTPLFRQQRWEALQNVEFEGMQTDIYIKSLDSNAKALVECKFQKEPIDAPTIFKLMGQANYEKVTDAYLLSVSDLNAKAKGVVERHKADPHKNFNLIVWSSETLVEVFMSIKNIDIPNIHQNKNINILAITLLITHTKDFYWVAEEVGEDGEPKRAIIFPILENKFSLEEWKTYFARYEIWQGVEIELADKDNSVTEKPFSFRAKKDQLENVILSKINQADSFDDYHRPCRPEDFFGRSQPQKQFWDFLNNVRDRKTDLRVVCFTGTTGVGKSSLILKLSESCYQNPDYKNSFYIYHIDVTSINPTKANLFVPSAIRKALQEAVNDQFIEILNHKIVLESTEPPFFDCDSILLTINKLEESNKTIIIIFDQFEEILFKESLSSVYNSFKSVAYEIDSLKTNIVLGFCWRTDISLPAKHQAYFTWHELERIRKNIDLNDFPFSEKDSQEVLNKFEQYLKGNGKQLPARIKKWLLENCQNSPWLIKKICGDIYNQNLNNSYFKDKKIITKFDIKKIFDRDMSRYIISEEHESCLKYVAANSPLLRTDVFTKFDVSVINSLLANKLIIETGNNYKIYWDIFREYIVYGTLPTINISYKPRTQISTLLKILKLLNHNLTKSELANAINLKESTVQNALDDLRNFFQVEQDRKTGKITVSKEIVKLGDNELSDILAEQIESHIVIKEIYNKLKPDQSLWYDEFKKILQKKSSEEQKLKPDTPKDYASRMLSWFCFAGLLEIRQDWLIARPINVRQGKQKGKASECEFKKRKIRKSEIKPGQLSLLDLLN
ncbi:hypothetical protein NOS3756_56160 (plasmid) [Nostoc sp. NIES-3756]|uniref:ATP-binding protein n=1 Tax=Nostoc sp. NIES-3756 TaxID=1751286 RepID=UPI00071FFD9F|nr:ATP-binding protein [Nostoc sp. NIES-3756]BAT56604.1 hypothetical protein NOS3756_56160 [Nostoc sp. NIES-3756]